MTAKEQVPRFLLKRWEAERAERERALSELKAMTPEQRLEACRDFVNATLDRGDDLSVYFYAPWDLAPLDEEGRRAKSSRYYGYGVAPYTKPEPALRYFDFTRDEFVTILKPMGKVDDWRDKLPPPIAALISSWAVDQCTEDANYGPFAGKRLKAARLALELDIETFYAPASMTKKTALKWEGGDIPSRFVAFEERRFKAISEAHRIPLEWLLCLDLLNAPYERRRAEKMKALHNERRLNDSAAFEAYAQPGTEVKRAIPGTNRTILARTADPSEAGGISEIMVLWELLEDGEVVTSGGFSDGYFHRLKTNQEAAAA